MCNTKVMKNHHTVAPTGRELVLQNRYLVSYVSSFNPNTDNFSIITLFAHSLALKAPQIIDLLSARPLIRNPWCAGDQVRILRHERLSSQECN